jgi:biopolymer transport protein ExbB
MNFDASLIIERGGPVGLVIIALSVIALAVTLYKVLQFVLLRVGSHRTARRAAQLWFDGQHQAAYAVVVKHPAPLSQVLAHAMRGLTHGTAQIESVKEDVSRVASEELRELRKYLRVIELVAQVAPLLGLLGTVVGMIQAFADLQQSGAVVNPAALAGGIWTALLTTAMGLTVAIVFSTISSWFDARIESERSMMETTLTGFLAHRITEAQARPSGEAKALRGGRGGHAD